MEIEYRFEHLAPSIRLPYGQYPLLNIWKNLGIEKEFKKIQKENPQKFSLNDAAFLITFMKALSPQVDFKNLIQRGNRFIGNPSKELTVQDLEDIFKKVIQYKDQLLTGINKRLNSELGKERTERIYYDVISTHLWAKLPASLNHMIRESQSTTSDGSKEIKTSPGVIGTLPDECFDATGTVIPENLPEQFFEQLNQKSGPIQFSSSQSVSVGLAFDQNGIPLDFEVYLGKISEKEKLKQFVEKLKKKYKVKQAVRAVNPILKVKPNLLEFLKNGFGFLVTQKITKLDPEILAKIRDPEGYQFINPLNPLEGKFKVLKGWLRPAEKGQEPVSCNLVGISTIGGKKVWVEVVKVKEALETDPDRKAKLQRAARVIPTLGAKGRNENVNVGNFRTIAYNFGKLPGTRTPTEDTTSTDGAQAVQIYRAMNQMRTYFQLIIENFPFTSFGGIKYREAQSYFFFCFLALLLVRVIQKRVQLKQINLSLKDIVEILQKAYVLVIRLKDNTGASFFFMDSGPGKTYYNDPWVNPDVIEELRNVEVGTGSPFEDVIETCGIQLIGGDLDAEALALLLGTKRKVLTDSVPKYDKSEEEDWDDE